MNFQTAIKTCFQKYVTFSGRARRREYWFWALFNLIVAIAAGFIDSAMFASVTNPNSSGPVGTIVTLAILLPSLSVSVRRLHDLDKSGWWVLIGLIPIIGMIIMIIWACMKGTTGDNRFGADPLTGTGQQLPV